MYILNSTQTVGVLPQALDTGNAKNDENLEHTTGGKFGDPAFHSEVKQKSAAGVPVLKAVVLILLGVLDASSHGALLSLCVRTCGCQRSGLLQKEPVGYPTTGHATRIAHGAGAEKRNEIREGWELRREAILLARSC